MRAKSFTLLQVVIAFGVLSVMGLLFVPGATAQESDKDKISANEKAVQIHLRLIANAAMTYKLKYAVYPTSLAILCKEGLLNKAEMSVCTQPGVDSKPLNGYLFQMTSGRTWTGTSFYVRCRPESPQSGIKCFAVDTTGAVATTSSY